MRNHLWKNLSHGFDKETHNVYFGPTTFPWHSTERARGKTHTDAGLFSNAGSGKLHKISQNKTWCCKTLGWSSSKQSPKGPR